MRRLPGIIVLIACLALLGLQLIGLHIHVSVDGFSGAPHAAHVHGGPVDEHDHDGDKDVSIFELAAGAKLLPFFLATVLTSLIPFAVGDKISTNYYVPVPDRRRVRWRPPLRAPPPLSVH